MTAKRTFHVNGIYHAFSRGNNKQKIFFDHQDYSMYLLQLKKALAKYNTSLLFYCFMPNHVHLCLRQESELPISKMIQVVHGRYSAYFNSKYGAVGHVFQGKFKYRSVQTDYYFIYLSLYVHLNPVNITQDVFAYEYSSLKEYVAEDSSTTGGMGNICNTAPLLALFLSDKNDYLFSVNLFMKNRINLLFETPEPLDESEAILRDIIG